MSDNLQTLEGKIEPIELEDEMRSWFIDYAMSVITDRALPDVRDGLKPSQRRVLVAMNDLGLAPNKQHRKCAKIAGDTSGNYHPHGEAVIYPTLVRMAQDFNMRFRWSPARATSARSKATRRPPCATPRPASARSPSR